MAVVAASIRQSLFLADHLGLTRDELHRAFELAIEDQQAPPLLPSEDHGGIATPSYPGG